LPQINQDFRFGILRHHKGLVLVAYSEITFKWSQKGALTRRTASCCRSTNSGAVLDSAWEVGFTEAEHYQVFLEGFEFGASAWLDRFDWSGGQGMNLHFRSQGPASWFLDDRRSKQHPWLRTQPD